MVAAILCLAATVTGARPAPLTLDFGAVNDPQLVEVLIQSLNQYVLDGATGAGERSAVAAELRRLTSIMEALGYRAARLREVPSAGFWAVEPGPLYRIGMVQVAGLDGSAVPQETRDLIRDAILGLPAKTAESGAISDLERRIIRRLSEVSFVLAKVKSRSLETDRQTATVTVKMVLDPGRAYAFGDIDIRGARRGENDIIIARAPFKAGERFETAKLLIYRKRLEQLGIFGDVRVEAGDEAGRDGRLPVQVTVKEVPPDAEILDTAAGPGAMLASAAMLAMAFSMFFAPRAKSRLTVYTLHAVSILLLMGAAGLAAKRVLQLAGILPF